MAPVLSPILAALFQPLYIGGVLSNILYGVGCAQTTWYYRQYTKDGRLLKFLVGSPWVVDTVHQVVLNIIFYHYLVNRCGQDLIKCLTTEHWSMVCQALPAAMGALIVECFYIGRIWILGRNKLVYLIVIPALTAFGISIAYVILNLQDATFPLYGAGLRFSQIIVSSTAAAYCLTDIATSITMCYLLRRSRTRGLTTSRSLLDLLIKFTVTTGLLSSMINISLLVVIVAPLSLFHRTAWVEYTSFTEKVLYVNSMLAVLNSRAVFRDRLRSKLAEDISESSATGSSRDT